MTPHAALANQALPPVARQGSQASEVLGLVSPENNTCMNRSDNMSKRDNPVVSTVNCRARGNFHEA